MTINDLLVGMSYRCAECFAVVEKRLREPRRSQGMIKTLEITLSCHGQNEVHTIPYVPLSRASIAQEVNQWLSEIEPFSGKTVRPFPFNPNMAPLKPGQPVAGRPKFMIDEVDPVANYVFKPNTDSLLAQQIMASWSKAAMAGPANAYETERARRQYDQERSNDFFIESSKWDWGGRSQTRPMCALCNKPVEDMDSWQDYPMDETIFRFRCHGRTEELRMSRRDIMYTGQRMPSVAFVRDAQILSGAAPAKVPEPAKPKAKPMEFKPRTITLED